MQREYTLREAAIGWQVGTTKPARLFDLRGKSWAVINRNTGSRLFNWRRLPNYYSLFNCTAAAAALRLHISMPYINLQTNSRTKWNRVKMQIRQEI